MLYIEPKSSDAAFHFAAEEFCMRYFEPEEPVWILWRTNRCVMLGRNQIANAEVDLQAAEQLQVQVVRRSSGGGTIYTDPDTLQYTLILPFTKKEDMLQIKRTRLAGPILDALNQMGIPARWQGRNDICVEGKKVSGLAQFAKQNRICSHGSLLYDTDLSILEKVLRPDESKIQTKALRSMRGEVTVLKHYCDPAQSINDFLAVLKQKLFKKQVVQEYDFSPEDIAQIEKIRAEKYASQDWLFGQTPNFTWQNSKRFPDGKIEVFLNIDKGFIHDCKIRGDFLCIYPIRELESKIERNPYQYGAISQLLEQYNLQPYIGSVTAGQLLSCLFDTEG